LFVVGTQATAQGDGIGAKSAASFARDNKSFVSVATLSQNRNLAKTTVQ
jgi:hypothetical protein